MMGNNESSKPRKLGTRSGRGSPHLVNVVIFLALVVAIAAVTVARREVAVQQSVYARILEQKLQAASYELRAFFRPVAHNLAAVRSWYQAGTLDLADPKRASDLLSPLCEPFPHLSSLYIQDPRTGGHRIARSDSGWHRVDGGASESAFDTGWIPGLGTSPPPQRPVWSGFIDLPAVGNPGLLGGLWWRTDAGTNPVVAAFGIRKQDLDRFVDGLPLANEGILVLAGEDDQIAWMSRTTGGEFAFTTTAALLAGSRPEHLLVSRGLIEINNGPTGSTAPRQFVVDGQRWWVSRFFLEENYGAIGLTLLMPGHELAARLEKVTNAFTYTLFGLLVVGLVLLVLLAFSYRRRLAAARATRLPRLDTEAELRRVIGGGETAQVEFKSTLRMNVQTGKPGKEVEMSWLKNLAAFLNSEGGLLVIGVADDGEILGVEPDGFPSEDRYLLHYNNLVKDHIGLQHARYLRSEMRSLTDRRIFTVACRRADEPVFLTVNQQESFYIRIGSGTRKLTTSQMLEYLGGGATNS